MMKRGSALLIVLGMLAFMVISAVAFSAYMRYSRLPSSFLRRSSSSRLLVKAALAEAIDEIDAAIGNNPHPGVGNRAPRATSGIASTGQNSGLNADLRSRNHWRGRVYIGTNQLHSVEDTVSTLTLEGLAYIPPSLVNEARYFSRRSSAGQWRKLGFDAGRCAFCAIDVSDFFDVHTLPASFPRSSSPSSRISLAYLFESSDHGSNSGGGMGTPSAWDGFMRQFTDSGKVPLVSMADWNLAVNQDRPGGLMSPFCQYITDKRTSFYGGISEQSADADAIRRLTFVTDSWFPSGTAAAPAGGPSKTYDLATGAAQPFTRTELRAHLNLYQIADSYSFSNMDAIRQYRASLNGLGLCALYDYLDRDDVPVSLAIPTVERTPMICGLAPDFTDRNLEVTPDPKESYENETKAARTAVRTVTYKLKGLEACAMNALLVYPFRHGTMNDTFTLDGRITYFLTVAGADIPLRTGKQADILHFTAAPNLTSVEETKVGNVIAAITVPMKHTGTIGPSTFHPDQGEKGAVSALLPLKPQTPWAKDITFLTVTYRWQQTKEELPGGGLSDWQPKDPDNPAQQMDGAEFGMGALDKFGTGVGDFANAVNLLKSGNALNLKMNMAVWARLTSVKESKPVDLVPACAKDDQPLNLPGNQMSWQFAQNQMGDGAGFPLLRLNLSGNAALVIDPAGAANNTIVAAGPDAKLSLPQRTLLVCDPRYNYAPESWFLDGGTLSADLWLQKSNRQGIPGGNIADRRDGDIFMEVSDQEYLQSIYELANIPRLTTFYQGGLWPAAGGEYEYPASQNRTDICTDPTQTANYRNMWRTYDPLGRYDDADFDRIGFVNNDNGFKVNPFSNVTNVILAALANTPHEWRVASTNEETLALENIPDDAQQFNRKYAWNAYSSGAKIDWEDLEDLAAAFIEDMHLQANVDDLASGSATWEDIWNDLGWCDFTKTGEECSKYLLKDMQLGDTSNDGRIWNCDRKFLYGYWHDCFANRQQLFLVFVRAEPAMMGGGAIGQTPPQLGARAVALVWRDPTPTGDERTPHRTRVLFYRQFD